jgi:hypothetical protein
MNNTIQPVAAPEEVDFDNYQTIAEIKLGVIRTIRSLREDETYTKENAIKELKGLLLLVIEHEDNYTGALINEHEATMKEAR